MNPKTTCIGSLKSYNPYLLPQKVSKNPHAFAFITTCPKQERPFFGH
jgi:hypothetical protein